MLGNTEGKRRRWQRMRWLESIQLNGHELEQTQGDNRGQGGLACCSSWGCKSLTQLSDQTGKYMSMCGSVCIYIRAYICIYTLID